MNALKVAIVWFLLLASVKLTAQDKIYNRSGSVITVKIIEISDEEVIYTALSATNGPSYSVSKDQILKVVFANGTTEVFTRDRNGLVKVGGTDPLDRKELTGLGHHIVSMDVFALLLTDIGLNYEFVTGNGVVGFKVPVLIGMSNTGSERHEYREYRYLTGLDVNLYPSGQGRFKYLVGPGFRIGEVYNGYSSWLFGGFSRGDQGNESMNFRAAFLNNGVMFQPTKRFYGSLVLGFGYRYINGTDEHISFDGSGTQVSYSSSAAYFTLSANFGIRF